jgi:hypothetical protein
MQREASVRIDVDVVVSLVVAGLVVAVILAASTCGSTLEKLGCGLLVGQMLPSAYVAVRSRRHIAVRIAALVATSTIGLFGLAIGALLSVCM